MSEQQNPRLFLTYQGANFTLSLVFIPLVVLSFFIFRHSLIAMAPGENAPWQVFVFGAIFIKSWWFFKITVHGQKRRYRIVYREEGETQDIIVLSYEKMRPNMELFLARVKAKNPSAEL